MNYIKSLHIEGFKKFQTLDVEFNEHMNILVGENEAGKSTIRRRPYHHCIQYRLVAQIALTLIILKDDLIHL